MSRKSLIERNKKRILLSNKLLEARKKLKEKIYDKSISLNERFKYVQKLASLPRSSSKTRVRNRCQLTGRPKGVYRKFRLSRIMIREYAGQGLLPGVIKSSW